MLYSMSWYIFHVVCTLYPVNLPVPINAITVTIFSEINQSFLNISMPHITKHTTPALLQNLYEIIRWNGGVISLNYQTLEPNGEVVVIDNVSMFMLIIHNSTKSWSLLKDRVRSIVYYNAEEEQGFQLCESEHSSLVSLDLHHNIN